jgi:maltose alpha-D-glucosyltransferase/alpha-amylase
MGDNIYLGDRDGVRTPMQWSPDRNAGFSRADPARLFLPVLQDAIYGFAAVNVEAQSGSPGTLLNWTRRMVAIRRTHRALGRGSMRFLYPANRKVLAYVREHEGERILCAANMSRAPQAVQLDLADLKGFVPRELTGGTAFPPIGDLPYLLTLPAYGFFWFVLSPSEAEEPQFGPRQPPELFTLVMTGRLDELFKGRELIAFERTAAPRFIAAQRWFGDKGAGVVGSTLGDQAVLSDGEGGGRLLALVDVETASATQRYFVPLTADLAGEEDALAPYAVARLRRGRSTGLLYDAASDPDFALDCLARMQQGWSGRTAQGGALRFAAAPGASPRPSAAEPEVRRLSADQSNTSLVIGDEVVLKLYRRVQPGVQPELEVARFLAAAGFSATPPLLGWIEHESAAGEHTALAVAQAFVRNQGDAWGFALDLLRRELDTIAALPGDQAPDPADIFESYRRYAVVLGTRTADLHRAFAAPTDDPAFAAEPFSADDLDAAVEDARRWAGRAFAALERLPEDGAARALLARRAEVEAALSAAAPPPGALKTRIHGDFHLGQVLVVQKDVVIVDFEGEPSRPADERRAKASPLRDVAGMLRSFSYAAETAARDIAARWPERAQRAAEAAETWRRLAADEYLATYDRALAGSPARLADPDARRALLRLFLLSKALYEIDYEASNRPDWIGIPVRGVLSLMDEIAER